jgi:hypothetical protein
VKKTTKLGKKTRSFSLPLEVNIPYDLILVKGFEKKRIPRPSRATLQNDTKLMLQCNNPL